MPLASLVLLVLPAVFLPGSGQVTNVQVIPYGTGFNATWDGTEAESYEVLYSTINDKNDTSSMMSETNSIFVEGLLPGTLYYVWVVETVNYTCSDVASVTTYSVPAKVEEPRGVIILYQSDLGLEITWTIPSSSQPITDFIIEVNGLSQESLSSNITIPVNRSTVYAIRVRAVSDIGEGNFSDVLTVTVGDAPAVPMVNVFELTTIDGVIYLNASWEAVEGADFYRIRLSSETFNTTETSLLTETMQEGLASLSAVSNLYGEGDGAQFNLTAPELGISRVTGLNLTILLGDTQVIEATWNPLTENISAYAIFVNSTSGEELTMEVPPSQTSFNLTSVEAGFEYRFEVAGRREDDLGPNGTASIQSYDVPEQVTDLTVIPGIEEGEPVILIRWTAPRSDAGIMNYIILYGVSSSELMQNVSIPANLEEPMFFNITGELGTDYSVQLAAVSVLGTGPFSNVTQITTFDVPGAVINLVGMPATSDGRPAVTLSWVKPDSDAPILQYTVRYGVGNSEPLSERTVSNLSLLVTDLELATEYYFSVYASSELGDGLISNTTTTTFNVPGVVSNLVGMPATSDGRPAVTLSWVEPNSDASILRYTVRYGVGNSEPLSERTVSNLSLLVTDLELATEYYFSVYATSELGNGSINNFTVVTTFNVPGPVVNLKATVELEVIALMWLAPKIMDYNTIIAYNMSYALLGERIEILAASTSDTFLNLSAKTFLSGETYTAEVVAISDLGPGPSKAVIFTTIAEIILETSFGSPYSLRVAWDDFGVSATKLVLSIEEKEVTTDHVKQSGHSKSFDLLPSNSSFIISDLKSNTPYVVTLQALDSNDSVVAYGSSQVRTPFGDCPATFFVPKLSSYSGSTEHKMSCSEIHSSLILGEVTWTCINETLVMDPSECLLKYRTNKIIITEWQSPHFEMINKQDIIDEEVTNLETNYGNLDITIYSLNIREDDSSDSMFNSVYVWVMEVPQHISIDNLTMTFLAGIEKYYLIQSTDFCECDKKNEFTLNSVVELCRIPDNLEAPCTCMEDICNCNQPFVEIGIGMCSLDLDADTIPDVEDPCVGCCNSEQSHLLTWPETLTGSTALLSCSLLSQAFNEKAYITRQCLSNGTWSNEDSTDCTFKPDTEPSTSVLLGVVTSTSDSPLTVEDFTSFGLSADILKFSEQENRELSTYSFSITVNFPVDREYVNELGANLSSQGVRLLSNSIYGYIANSTCACPLSYNLTLLDNGRCIGPPGPTCLCSSDTCECQSPYARVDGLGDLYCEVDSDGDGVADSQDVCPNHYGRTPPCSVTDSEIDCPSETDQYGLVWPGARSGETVGQACSKNGSIIGSATRECSGQGQWLSPNVLDCEDVTLRDVMETTNTLSDTLGQSNVLSDATLSTINTATEVLLATTSSSLSAFPTSLNITANFLAVSAKYAEQTDLFTHNQYNPMELLQITDNVLDVNSFPGWDDLNRDVWSGGSPSLLMSIETIAKALSVNTALNTNAMTLPDGAKGVVFHGDFIAVQASRRTSLTGCPNSDGKDYTEILYPAEADLPFFPQSFGDSESLPQITIPGALLQERVTDNCKTVPVFNLIFRNFSQLLPREYNDGRSFGNYETESYVISSQVADVGQKSNSLKNEPVLIEFPLTSSRVPTSARCVFWNFTTTNPNSQKVDSTQLGGWSDEGVITEIGDSIICKSQHLTSFAVLVDYAGIYEPCTIDAVVFSILTYIGCGISIVCLVITIIFFFSLKREVYKNMVHFVHVNFSIALLIALIFFVGGVSHAGTIKEACTVVSVLLHYFLLSSFTWMLCEGIMVYMCLVKVFGAHERKWLCIYSLIGWGLPVPIVVVSIAVRHNQYYSVAKDCDGNDMNLCWLPSENGLIWAFLAPVIAIILVNIIFAVLAIRSVLKLKKAQAVKTGMRKNTEKLFWYALKSFAIILPLLGLTWLFGILAANPWNRGLSIAFSCLFIIFNSLQGFCVFVFHVVRHEKNWERLRKRWKRSTLKTEQTKVGASGKPTFEGATAEDLVMSEEGKYTIDQRDIPMKDFVKDSSNLQKEWSVIVNKSVSEEKNEKDSEEADTQGEDQLETKEQEVDEDEGITYQITMETPEIMDEESKPVSKEKEANPEITTDPEKEAETSRDPEANSKITTTGPEKEIKTSDEPEKDVVIKNESNEIALSTNL